MIADKLFERQGFVKSEYKGNITYHKKCYEVDCELEVFIVLDTNLHTVSFKCLQDDEPTGEVCFYSKTIDAIYMKCIELGWGTAR